MPRRYNPVTHYAGVFLLLVIFIAGSIAVINYFAPGALSSLPISVQKPTQPATNEIDVTKQLKVTVMDELAGSPIGSATVVIRDAQGLPQETLATLSDGSATSSMLYTSGASLIFEISKAGYVTSFFSKTVPKMAPADAESLSVNPITIKAVKTAVPTITVLDSNGAPVSDGATLNFSGTSMTFTVTVANTLDNSGWKTTTDPLNKVNLGLVAKATASNGAVISGTGSLISRPEGAHLVTPIPDNAICKQKVGNDYPVYKGVYSYSITVNKGTLASGQTTVITIKVIGNFDTQYFNAYGIGSPSETVLATFTFNLSVP